MQMPKFSLTRHSNRRKDQRGITDEMIVQVLEHGRQIFTRGAIACVVGRKEVRRQNQFGIDISNLDGIHVICPTDKFGTVITAYRNRDLSGVKPNMGRGRYKPKHIHSRKPLPRTSVPDRSAWIQELGMPA